MNFDDDDDAHPGGCQCGNGLAGFEGVRYQKGFGLLGNLFAKALPYLKQFGKYIGKKLLGLGSDIASDVVDGKPIKESVKQRVKSSAKIVAEDGMTKLQDLFQKGNGRRRRVARKARKPKRRPVKTCKRIKIRKSNKRRKVTKRKRVSKASLGFLS